jgi:hypothetical protein
MWGNNLYTPDDGTPIAYLRLVDIKSAEGLAYSVDYAAKDIAAIIISYITNAWVIIDEGSGLADTWAHGSSPQMAPDLLHGAEEPGCRMLAASCSHMLFSELHMY